MKKLKFNKKILIVFLLLSVFAVGTMGFADTVEAAKWKKYDSGKYADEYPVAGYKKVISYQSYTKGNNNLYVDTFAYPKTGGKKLIDKTVFTKKNNIIKITSKNYFSNETMTGYFQTKLSVKKIYKDNMKVQIKDNSIPPEKKAFEKQSFTVNNDTYKVYGIKWDDYTISAYIYKNNVEYCGFGVYYVGYLEWNKKIINNKNVYREYNQKRKLVASENFSPSQSLLSIYQNKINILINKIKSA